MKGLYLIAVAFLVQTAIAVNETTTFEGFEAEDKCPAKDTCPPKLIFHPTDCSRYYECNEGKKKLKNCKTGLHFSKKWQGCVKPALSECEDDSGSGGDGGSGETECDEDGRLLPHECQCNKFYECKNDRKVLHVCSSGEYFDEDRESCIPGDCGEPSKTECEDGDYLPHECQCTKYYECKNSRKALRGCTKGSYFDKKSLKCKKGTCPDEEGEEICRAGTKKSHDCSCEKYYTCKSKEWVLEECKTGQHFSPTKLKCMSKKTAKCEEDSTTKPPKTTTPEPDDNEDPGECNPKKVPTRWAHECDCRLYYECIKKQKVIQACAWGRYYDHVNQVCERAAKVSTKCKNSWDDWV